MFYSNLKFNQSKIELIFFLSKPLLYSLLMNDAGISPFSTPQTGVLQDPLLTLHSLKWNPFFILNSSHLKKESLLIPVMIYFRPLLSSQTIKIAS